MSAKQYVVYILSNPKRTVLYIGVTNDLRRRVWEHKKKAIEGFTKRYNVVDLLFYELFDDPTTAIAREKQLKHWKRIWKDELIQKQNPKLRDLYPDIL